MQPVFDHTLTELQILPQGSQQGSLLNYFDKTKTPGGRACLKELITKPKKSLKELLDTQDFLKLIDSDRTPWEITISRSYVIAAQNYQESPIVHSLSQDVFQHWVQTLLFALRHPADFDRIRSGLSASLRTLSCLKTILSTCSAENFPPEIQESIAIANEFLNSKLLKPVLNNPKTLSRRTTFYLDYYFRTQHKQEFQQLLDLLYTLDAYVAIVRTAQDNQLNFPQFTTDSTCFEATNLWHPLLKDPVKNDFTLNSNPPVCVLTGANTSGKTSFLKATGVALYLAHLGWPVPAETLRISFYDHLITSLHLSDDLEQGYSHFYNEIQRIKSAAELLNQGNSCFVLVDELFRGTNQEDAIYCSKVVLDGFSNFGNSIFIISTHIRELLDHYQESESTRFFCFKTLLDGENFITTYRLEAGIATEKIGRLLLTKAGIAQLLSQQS